MSAASDARNAIQHEAKPSDERVETNEKGDLAENHNDVLLKSDQDHLTLWQTAWRFRKAVIVCNLLSIAAAADGYQYTLNGNIIANQGFINHIGFLNAKGAYTLNAQYTALWGAMQSLGQLLGMVFLNIVSDKIGRKMTLYILWVFLAVSVGIETGVRDWRDWAGAKLIAGIGIGAIQSTLPIYVTEWAPVNIRGAMLFFYHFWNTIGKFLAPLFLMIVQSTNELNYRVPILTQWAFLGIMLPIFIWLPETPAYYAARDQDEKGKATLARVNGKVVGYDVELEYAIIKNTIMEEKRERREAGLENQNFKEIFQSYLDCFRGTNAVRTLGAALPGCAAQLTGVSFLNTYASLFFKQSGFSNAFLITAIIALISLATATFLILFTDTFGRRNLTLVSSVMCTLMMLLIGILDFAEKTAPLKNFLIFIACFWSFFSSALGALGWAFVGEIASQKLRARTGGLAAGAAVLFGLTFNTSLPIMLDVNGANWGYKTAWLFVGCGLLCSVVVLFFVPEPSRRSSAEMDEMYAKKIPAWRMAKYVTDVQRVHETRAEKLVH